jgi:hypothetical protein
MRTVAWPARAVACAVPLLQMGCASGTLQVEPAAATQAPSFRAAQQGNGALASFRLCKAQSCPVATPKAFRRAQGLRSPSEQSVHETQAPRPPATSPTRGAGLPDAVPQRPP